MTEKLLSLGLLQRRMGSRKILVLKETDPPVKEVVQGIPAASTASKKKVRKSGRTTEAALPAQDTGMEISNTTSVDERSPIDLSLDDSKQSLLNSGLDLMEQLREQGS
uniref:Uncharacterized protein n=1 Tax=Cannabis sativa TaxID=3483 RepID=A0A803PL87_CANSA